jgi:hypothetical protein
MAARDSVGWRRLCEQRGLSKRTPEELAKLVTKFHAHVARHPGQRIEQIGKMLAVPSKELVIPAKEATE